MDSGGRSAHSRRSSSVGGIPMEAEGENPNSGSRYHSDIRQASLLWAFVDMWIRLPIDFLGSDAFLFALVYSERSKESPTFWIREPCVKVVPKTLAMRIPNFPTWKVFQLSSRILSARDTQGLQRHTVYIPSYRHNRRVKCQCWWSIICSEKGNTDSVWGRKPTCLQTWWKKQDKPLRLLIPMTPSTTLLPTFSSESSETWLSDVSFPDLLLLQYYSNTALLTQISTSFCNNCDFQIQKVCCMSHHLRITKWYLSINRTDPLGLTAQFSSRAVRDGAGRDAVDG